MSSCLSRACSFLFLCTSSFIIMPVKYMREIMENFQAFCNQTSLHGWQYITQRPETDGFWAGEDYLEILHGIVHIVRNASSIIYFITLSPRSYTDKNPISLIKLLWSIVPNLHFNFYILEYLFYKDVSLQLYNLGQTSVYYYFYPLLLWGSWLMRVMRQKGVFSQDGYYITLAFSTKQNYLPGDFILWTPKPQQIKYVIDK